MYNNRISPEPGSLSGSMQHTPTLPPKNSDGGTQVSDTYNFDYVNSSEAVGPQSEPRSKPQSTYPVAESPPKQEVQPSYHEKDIESAPAPVQPDPSRQPAAATGKQKVIIGAGEAEGQGCCANCLIFFMWIITILFFPFTICMSLKVVAEYERAVIFRLGKLKEGGAAGPGTFCVLPCVDSFVKVDLRTVSFDVPPQEILTRDSVTVAVDAVVYFRVSNAIISIANVENATRSTQLLAATTLRTILGQHNLTEVLSEREQISNMFQDQLDSATEEWGIDVERVEIKDVRLPVQLQRAMAAEAEATREAKAKVIAAEGEQKASRSLKEAADVISATPSALQLRYLQTLTTISAEKNSTIVFPFPTEMLRSFKK